MRHAFPYLYLMLALALILWPGCEDEDLGSNESCGFDLPQVSYSGPKQCEPTLTFLRNLETPAPDGPTLPLECPDARNTGRTVFLNSPVGTTFVLHVYNGTAGWAHVQIFGIPDCDGSLDEAVAVSECVSSEKVAFKVPVDVTDSYDGYYARIDFSESGPGETYEAYEVFPGDFFALAAYDRGEPSGKGELSHNSGQQGNPADEPVRPPADIPVACDGFTLQRIILSSCDPNDDIKLWAQETGLEISEVYQGEGGCVVALDVPSGLDVNTTGLAGPRHRPRMNTEGGVASVDFLINLFTPKNPSNFGGSDNGWRFIERPKSEEVEDCLAPAEGTSSEADKGVLVTIIDSGVDESSANVDKWNRHIYKGSKSTSYIRAGRLGYDFINVDEFPEDQSPHGTYVGGAIVNGYRGAEPLTAVHFKMFGAQSASSYFGALVAIRQAIAINSDIINMSWGFYSDEEPPELRCLVESAANQGIAMVTSSGNDTTDLDLTPQWPAAFAGDFPNTVLTASSYFYQGDVIVQADVAKKDFANFGLNTTTLAAYETTAVPQFGGSGIVYPLGTSISAPIVARTLANFYSENPGSDVEQFRKLFVKAGNLTGQIPNGNYLPVCTDGIKVTSE